MGTLNLDIYFKTTWEYQSVRLQKYNEDVTFPRFYQIFQKQIVYRHAATFHSTK